MLLTRKPEPRLALCALGDPRRARDGDEDEDEDEDDDSFEPSAGFQELRIGDRLAEPE